MKPHLFAPVVIHTPTLGRPFATATRAITKGQVIAHFGGIPISRTTYEQRAEREPRYALSGREVDGFVIYDPEPELFEACLSHAGSTGNIDCAGNYAVARREIGVGETLRLYIPDDAPNTDDLEDLSDATSLVGDDDGSTHS